MLKWKEARVMGTRGMIILIKAYQRWISPLKGQTCRFHPTCSAYSLTAYERFGFWRGTGLMVRRLAKCHPFHPGGVDHVPEKERKASKIET